MDETNLETAQLYEMNPLERFSDRAADYAKYRPSYPATAIDRILEGLGEPSELLVADVGAGTGIASRLFAARGIRVRAIEPNAEMRKAAEFHQLVEFQEGTAEATNLDNESVDLVVCFQSFHWFNPELTLAEFRRIIKPRGRLALVWNDRDRTDNLTEEYTRLVRKASNNHPAEERLKSSDALFASPLFTNVRRYDFANKQEVDLAGLIGRAQSVSYIPRTGVQWEQLMLNLQELYDRYHHKSNFISLSYCTSVFLADPVVRSPNQLSP